MPNLVSSSTLKELTVADTDPLARLEERLGCLGRQEVHQALSVAVEAGNHSLSSHAAEPLYRWRSSDLAPL
jgi:hypothetical protein